jgi:GT2 family glycosyltransferase
MNIGVVAIGRNEGLRLKACLDSLIIEHDRIVYVDSGSTDDSIQLAKRFNVTTLELDMTLTFTAARARNFGFRKLLELYPDIEFVQFIDGDCKLVEGWTSAGVNYLVSNRDVAIVCGRRREMLRGASVYNMLCDIEWDTPIGEARGCGGDAIVRVSAFKEVGGFNDLVIAGEEPELCFRLRQANWKIWRLDHDMTLHDAAIHCFAQWWKRAVRGGYAFTLGSFMHGDKPERHWVRESLSITFWGAVVPLTIIVLSFSMSHVYLFLLLIYPLQVVRVSRQVRYPALERFCYATFVVIGKFAEFQGQLKFLRDYFLERKATIIEYK